MGSCEQVVAVLGEDHAENERPAKETLVNQEMVTTMK